jgi:membrane-bound lytic murein transglycosylase C
MRIVGIFSFLIIFSISNTVLISQDMDKTGLKEYRENYQQNLDRFKQAELDKYQQFKQQQIDEFESFKEEVQKKWNTFKTSNRKKFVRYSKNLDSRSEVDFEKGYIEIEVQAENIEEKSDSIEDKIIKELKAIVSTKDAESIPIVEDQLPKEVLQPQVDTIDPVKVQKYLKKKKPKKKSVVAKDKKKRIQYTVKIPLVKNHLSKRATKYSSMVKKQASRFNLDPSLVMAIIHVESHFNPMAKSHIPAYGLMQLVPESGARDSYSKLFGKDWVPSERYLLSPKKNIELGCNYLSILKNQYFKEIKDSQSKEYCIIAGYNTGSGNVSRAFTGQKNIVIASKKINKLSSRKVKQRLLNQLPYKETKKYLVEVLEKRKLYL